ncbi:MAG: efflux RND transporter periplasmic adaptor subunit [Planctomycetia bacterium]|nr:efflux RND transporter periplasmic adaptor subunit [Planctomycetia bacterium]
MATAPKLREELASLRIDRSKRSSHGAGRAAFWVAVLALALVGGGIGAFFLLHDRISPPPAVKVDTVRLMSPGQVDTVLTATGYLESRQQAAVGAKAPGRVARVLVEEGDKVEQGDLLAELEHADLDAILASKQIAVKYAEAVLAEAKNHVAQRERDFAREQALFARNAGTQVALETAETEYRVAAAHVDALEANVAGTKASVREAQEAIANLQVHAPFAGTIVTKDAEVGETIMPGGMGLASGRGSVATLANLDQLEVDTDVKEDYLGQLMKGQPALVSVDAVPNSRYRGRLREIIPMGDRTRGIVKVKVTVLNPDERLFPELSATVHFQPARSEREAGADTKQMFVPAAAVVERQDRKFVWRLEQDHVAQVSVTTDGESRNGLVRVEGNLQGGQRVVIDPAAELTEGARVRVLE